MHDYLHCLYDHICTRVRDGNFRPMTGLLDVELGAKGLHLARPDPAKWVAAR
jgi:hypothetical protein